MQPQTPSQTVLSVIRTTLNRAPAVDAVVFPVQPHFGSAGQVRVTNGELDCGARALAACLGPGSRPVVLVLPPGPAYLTAFLACVYSGAPAVPIYPPNPADARRDVSRLRAVLDSLPEASLLTSPELLEPLRAMLADQLPEVNPERLINTATPDGAEQEWQEPRIDPGSPVFIQFTSGSTGTPRGVLVSHRNVLANVAAIRERFGLGPASTGVLWLPPYHDMGLVGGILTPLLTGFPMHLISPLAFLTDPMAWLRLASDTAATHTGAPNFGYALATRRATDVDIAELDLSRLQVAFCGAEPINAETLRAFAERFAPAGFRAESFLPCYGLAENTLIVSGVRPGDGLQTRRVDSAALAEGRVQPVCTSAPATELVSNGKPAAGTDIAVADPRTGATLGVCEIGEILVAGDSVAAGYLKEPAATEQTFGATLPHCPVRWLRTGDLGYRTEDDNLFVVGRIKDVIIVRGRNIYPQDVERTVEYAHPGIRSGCVAVVGTPDEDGGEEVLIVAELRRGHHEEDSSLGAEVADAVRVAVTEQHSVPVRAVHLIQAATLPKTSSGKVQRSAVKAAYHEGTLATIWCDAETGSTMDDEPSREEWRSAVIEQLVTTLIARVGGRGGTTRSLDSLAVVQLVTEINQVFRVSVTIPEVLAGLDVSELAKRIRAAQVSPTSKARPAELPATSRQQALGMLQEIDPGSPGLVLGVAFRLPPTLDVSDVGRRLVELVERHEALRSRLVLHGGRWLRVVDPPERSPGAEPWGRYCSLVRLHPDKLSRDQFLEELDTRCRRILDLAKGPLFYAEVVLAEGHGPHLVIQAHHAVVDLWSIGILAAELAILLGGQGQALELPTPLASTEEPDGQRRDRAWRFWQDLLTDEIDPVALPPAEPITPLSRGGSTAARRTVCAPLDLGTQRSAAISALARRCGTTRYAVLLAAQAVTLARLTGTDRVPITVALHGRGAGTARAVDYLVSTVALPVDTAGGTAADLITRVARSLRGALAHQTFGYQDLVACSSERNGPAVPLPEVALLLQQDTPGALVGAAAGLLGMGGIQLGEVELTAVVPVPSVGPFSLVTLLTDYEGRLLGRVDVDPSRYQPWLAERFAASFVAVVDGLTVGYNTPLIEITAVSANEAERLRDWSQSALPAATDSTLHQLVLATAERHPDREAVLATDGSLTYRELAVRSAAIAAGLAAAGVGKSSAVGVLFPRRRDLLCALLGVLRAGAAYIPLDATTPDARLTGMINDARCDHLLIPAELADQRHVLPVASLVIDDLLSSDGSPPDHLATPDDAAYVLFTSGSTGRPKGVVIRHASAVNLVRWAGTVYSAQELADTCAITPITFDLSVFELFVPLAYGCRVRLLGSVVDLVASPEEVAGATLLNTVPSAVAMLLEHDALPRSVRVVNMAGEPLTAQLVHAVHNSISGVRVVNLYGPSETTTYSTYAELGANTVDPVPIGRPVDGTSLHLVDADLRPVPIGGTGELLISGAGVAIGYAGQPALTASRFLIDPQHPGQRLYRTGDLVRWLPDRQLGFIGRVDHQVKVRGFRVEPSDVEGALRAVATLREVAVLAVGKGTSRRLAAYLVPTDLVEGNPIDWLRGVRQQLGQKLPNYLVPSEFALLAELPRNRHGKLDRRRLSTCPTIPLVAKKRLSPRTDLERRVLARWTEVLAVSDIGVTDDFLDVGGHSLLVARIAHLLSQEFAIELKLAVLWDHRTVAEQAELVGQLLAAGTIAAPAHRQDRHPIRRLDRRLFTATAAAEGKP